MNRKNGEEKVKNKRISWIDEQIREGMRTGKYPNAMELAKNWGAVGYRTILRDIEFMKDEYGAPIEYDFNKKGFYYSEPTFFIKSVLLTENELEAIRIYKYFLAMGGVGDNNLDLDISKVLDKILEASPEKLTVGMPFNPSEKYPNDFDFKPAIIIDPEINQKLMDAIKNKEVVEAEYWTTNNRKYSLITLKPLQLFYDKDYYLLAFENENYKKPGIFAPNRIRKIKSTGIYFEIPANLKMKDYIKRDADVYPADNKIYFFELSFPKEFAAEAIERTYYHNQTVELREDGTLYVSFRSTQLFEVFYWILKQGQKVKALNPPELVTLMKKEVQKIGKYYL
jgi:proteasome accessory factor B